MNETPTQLDAAGKAALVLDVLAGRLDAAAAAASHGLPLARVEAWLAAAQRAVERALAEEAPAVAQIVHGDLRDLIPRPFDADATVTVSPTDSLSLAWQCMRQHDVSQLPVMEGARIVGMLDESDVLLHVYGDEARFADAVAVAMVSRLDKVAVRAPVEALLPVFDRGHVAIVMEGDHFLGLITRIDLLNFLRRRAG